MTHEAGELPEQGARRLLDQTLEFWIRPEVERRSQAKLLPNGFQLLAGQVLFDLDAGAPRVRINEEVRALASVRTPQPLTPGEPVMSNQVDEFVHIELTDDDPNEGHITLVRHKGGWAISFSFQYNAQRMRETIKLAEEFLEAARHSIGKKHLGGGLDTLFSSVELLAKAWLLPTPPNTKSH